MTDDLFDNGKILLGKVIRVKEYICKNADDITEVADLIKDLEDLDEDTIVAINYDNPMGWTIEYWTYNDIVNKP